MVVMHSVAQGKVLCWIVAMFVALGVPGFAGAQSAPASGTRAAAQLPDPSSQVVMTPYGRLTFAEIRAHPKRDEILDDIMTSAEVRAYQAWRKEILEAANKRIQEKDANIEAANKRLDRLEAEGRALTLELIRKHTQYVDNIERGASGERSVLDDIRSKIDTPDDLKRRIDAMLRRTDLKIR